MKANFETGLKICSKCRRELPLSSFGKDIHQPDGLEYSCKECSLKRRRDYLKTKRTKEEIFQTRANLEKGTKICSKCRREFSLDHFHKCKNSYDGFGGQCIFCERAYRELGRNKETQEKWKEENKEKIREWRLSERGKAASRRAYLKAKSSGRLQKWEKKKRKEDLKELVLYTVFGNMTFIISIGAYAVFNVALGINELIANALAWVFAVLFSYMTNEKWVFRVSTPTKTAAFVQMFAFFSGRFFTLIIEETIIFVFITMLSYPSMWVKLTAQVVVVVLNYIISKLFVFKNQ